MQKRRVYVQDPSSGAPAPAPTGQAAPGGYTAPAYDAQQGGTPQQNPLGGSSSHITPPFQPIQPGGQPTGQPVAQSMGYYSPQTHLRTQQQPIPQTGFGLTQYNTPHNTAAAPPPPPAGGAQVASNNVNASGEIRPTSPHHTQRRVYPDVEDNAESGGYGGMEGAMQNLSVSGQYGQPHASAAPSYAAPGGYGAAPYGQAPGQPYGAQPGGQPYAQPGGQPYQPQGQQPGYAAPAGQPQYGAQTSHFDQVVPDATNQCPSKYLSMTCGVVPAAQSILSKSAIPFGCTISPLATPDPDIPLVSFGSAGIVRCRRCRTYINPFVVFTDAGKRWRCNICEMPNEIPQEYYAPIDPVSGRRTDLEERPELRQGFVEFLAPSEYMVRAPQPPVYFFMIDVCYSSITSGMLNATVQAISASLDALPGDTRTQVGFITYDKNVHFYNLRSSLSRPQMLVVSDTENVFLPVADDLLVNLKESRHLVDALLQQLPNMFAHSQQVESALGPAVKSAFNVIKHIGGKLLIFQANLPAVGAGKITNREDPRILGTDKENTLFVPAEPAATYYKELALDCSRQQISIDLYVFPTGFMDVATLGVMPQITGGELMYYPSFRSDLHGQSLIADIHRNCSRHTSWEGVMRVRCSKGLKVTAHHGNFFIRSTDLLALPATDEDKSFSMQLALSENLTNVKYSCIQAALLYTTSSGERRIRVLTVSLPVTTSVSDIFKHVDCPSMCSLMAKMAIDKVANAKISDAREAVVNKCIDVLTAYRDSFSGGAANQGQLMIPESLRLLPLYALAIAKSPLFRPGDVRPDERAFHMYRFKTLSVPLAISFIYPSFYNASALTPEVLNYTLPAVLNLSSEKLDRRAVFVLENSYSITVYVPKGVPSNTLMDLFGVEHLTQLPAGPYNIPEIQTSEANQQLRGLIQAILQKVHRYLRVDIVREGDPSEQVFLLNLIEDRARNITSYYEFMVQLQRSVASKTSK